MNPIASVTEAHPARAERISGPWSNGFARPVPGGLLDAADDLETARRTGRALLANRDRIDLHHVAIVDERDLTIRKADHEPPRPAFGKNLGSRSRQNRQELDGLHRLSLTFGNGKGMPGAKL